MNRSRVVVYDALYNLLSGYIQSNYQNYANVPQFATFSKNFKPWEKTLSDEQPAFYLHPGPEAPDQDETGFGITRWELTFYVYIFIAIDQHQENPTPGEILLATVDMVDDAMFNLGQPQTLASQNGGKPLVANAWIDKRAGKVELRVSILKPQAAIVIPITVLTGSQQPGQRTQ